MYITDLKAWLEIAFKSHSSNPLRYAESLYLDGVPIKDNLVIPDGVTSIGKAAFVCCSGLISVIIPDSVTSIGDDAFFGCDSLTSVVIGNGVTTIGKDVFTFCSRLTSVTIGNNVTNIGEGAFWGCSSLTSIHFNGTKAEWNAISKSFYSYEDEDTYNYTVYCTDGNITK